MQTLKVYSKELRCPNIYNVYGKLNNEIETDTYLHCFIYLFIYLFIYVYIMSLPPPPPPPPPPTKGRGHIVFRTDPVGIGVKLLVCSVT